MADNGRDMKHVDLPAWREPKGLTLPSNQSELSPGDLNDLGVKAAEQGRHSEAISWFRAAIHKNPQSASIYSNYALSLRDLGFFADAIKILEHASILETDNPLIFFNLANLHYETGDVQAALALYDKAVRLNGLFPTLYLNYALVALEAQEYALALRLTRRGIELGPKDGPLYDRLIAALAALDAIMGNVASALARIEERLIADENPYLAFEYVRLLSTAESSDLTMRSIGLVERAIAEHWAAPEKIAPVAWGRLMFDRPLPDDPADVTWPLVADQLLSSALIPGLDTEQWLVRHRRALFERTDDASLTEREISFFSSLAQQSFLRNYLFPREKLEQLRRPQWTRSLERSLDGGEDISPLWILRLAASMPLHHIREPARLLQLPKLPAPLAPLLRQQVENPLRERDLEPTIPTLASCKFQLDPVWLRYRSHPYPQWTWPGQLHQPERFNIYLAQRLGHSDFAPLRPSSVVRILVAGCGTGRHSHFLARTVSDAAITAIDISRPSLAFAQRQKLSDNAQNVEYLEADLSQLAGWDARFDVIECAGVLHHLQSPEDGLRILLSLLKDDGLIMLALYSRRARMPLRLLHERLGVTEDRDLRSNLEHARKLVIDNEDLKSIASFRDFFALNECADLLLHPRERTYDPLDLQMMLARHKLTFRGLELSSAQRNLFKVQYRNRADLLDLEKWDRVEAQHPSLFCGMYHFWAQKHA
jgi:SAM-dependent methyltransferase